MYNYVYVGLIAVVVIIVLWAISIYNKLIKLRTRVANAGAQINVQLKRRADLIPNLVETVKGYAKHESETFEKVIAARNMVSSATSIEAGLEANDMLTGTLKTLFAVAEAYPELKADQNFIDLQKNLKDTEDKIMFARQAYNDTVTKYNTQLSVFPANIIANMFGFEAADLFTISSADMKTPKVTF